MANYIYESIGYPSIDKPTTMYEDNAACIRQISSGFVKGDKTKHIAPKFFYTSEINGTEIEVTKIASEDNLADIFTKSLGSNLHWHFVPLLGLRRLSNMDKM
jgi:hypothetical protein